MNKFWSPFLEELRPYQAGEQPQDKRYIKLNTNENPYPPSPRVLAAIKQELDSDLRLYPDPEATELKETIAATYGLQRENVFTGNGSDEVLAHCFQAFFRNNRPLSFPQIGYSFYPVYCDLFAIPVDSFPLGEGLIIDADAIPPACGGLIFANPNAPTGLYLEPRQVEAIVQAHSDKLVIIDEAYIDFGGKTAASLIQSHANLVVVQTFSKSHSLAGLRVGYALGQEELILALETVKNSFNSYPLDRLAIAGGIAALKDHEHFQINAAKICAARDWATAELRELGFEVLESKANFVFAQHPKTAGRTIYRELKQRGILIRHFDKNAIDNFVRITIGRQDEMEALTAAMRSVVGD